ncbi:manganese efflux pump MntP [Paenibacillus sp. 481]|uniref:manganese efflux pump MntP n=1 Tax=Paenibacillus sp. 481 TaxID=2835869 RepID=UPI001E5C30D6|nr:manganese efflux pump [Paenibacillus sp. 481]UHA75649.1 manganese efflux pump [Paenibacillus sp. 481]
MWETIESAGQWTTIIIMAVALGFDAFSLCLGIGMRGVRHIYALRVSFVIGMFHILMPLIGILTGVYMTAVLGNMTTFAAGGLLIMLGIHMLYSSLKGSSSDWIDISTLGGMFLFAASVSVDAFSVGVSLGLYRSDLWLTICAFGLFGGLMSVLGLMLGNRIGQRLGEYGEAAGGAILLAFGVLFLFPS